MVYVLNPIGFRDMTTLLEKREEKKKGFTLNRKSIDLASQSKWQYS